MSFTMRFNIEKLIRDGLSKKNMTVSDLARELGVSRVTIYNLFEGQFSRKLIQQVAQYFSIPVHVFLMDANTGATSPNTTIEQELIDAYHASGPHAKNVVNKILSLEHTAIPDGRKPKIMIVDDVKDNLDLLMRILRNDFEVYGFTNPIEALEFIKKEVVDAVITDQRMPEMTGSSLLTAIHKLEKPVVKFIVSGYTDTSGFMEAINDAHADAFLVKPVKPVELRDRIQGFFPKI